MTILLKDILLDMLNTVKSYFYISCAVTFFIFMLWLAVYSWRYKHGKKNKPTFLEIKKIIFSFAFIGCCLMIFFETIYSRANHSRESLALIFSFGNGTGGIRSGIFEIENIILFLPVGFLLGGIYKKKFKLTKIFFTSALMSFTIETVQLLTGRGYFQISDLITNISGGFFGGIAYIIIAAILRWILYLPDSEDETLNKSDT